MSAEPTDKIVWRVELLSRLRGRFNSRLCRCPTRTYASPERGGGSAQAEPEGSIRVENGVIVSVLLTAQLLNPDSLLRKALNSEKGMQHLNHAASLFFALFSRSGGRFL